MARCAVRATAPISRKPQPIFRWLSSLLGKEPQIGPKFIAGKTVKLLIGADRSVKGTKFLVLGWTFKENVPDVRKTGAIDIHKVIEAYGAKPMAFDLHAALKANGIVTWQL
jgi:UDP-N-acetyl-D-mannosaminuronate dehydrogenase